VILLTGISKPSVSYYEYGIISLLWFAPQLTSMNRVKHHRFTSEYGVYEYILLGNVDF
jgi:hypothetical protein